MFVALRLYPCGAPGRCSPAVACQRVSHSQPKAGVKCLVGEGREAPGFALKHPHTAQNAIQKE